MCLGVQIIEDAGTIDTPENMQSFPASLQEGTDMPLADIDNTAHNSASQIIIKVHKR